ncbi:hypothetical protein [Microbulbifer sp. VAAF005]|uniref:hypothetical protein n=1 Tax=Microbulbifer sp. VAAF005 TaxID=3034230 RepID=UPI0024ADBB41|nr:hypothetical protein [Microbulbifer sp. VAAF005]WHI46106.1 hypothetical protein P0078_20670 [Microbulbifer sp. VAAF005]
MNELFDSYSKYPKSRLSDIGLDDEAIAFMSEVGLPNWCAPNMYFGDEETWLPAINYENEILYAIGSDRDDYPICINGNFVVVRLRDGEQDFMATNLLKLSQSLHLFQECINGAVDIDDQAYIKNNIPSQYVDSFVAWLKKNEPEALINGAFWLGVLRWLNYKI